MASQQAHFEATVGLILAAETTTEVRRTTEAQLLNFKASNPVLFAQHLLAVTCGHKDEAFRSFAAVTLRRDIGEVWDPLSTEQQLALKSQLLYRLSPPPGGEPKKQIRKQIADLVGRLGWDQVEDGGWPELLPTLFSTLSNIQPGSERDVGSQESWKTAFYVIGVLSHRLANTSLKPHFPALQSNFARFLSPQHSLGVRVAALKCLCTIVVYAAEGSLLVSEEKRGTPAAGAGAAAAAAAVTSGSKRGKEDTVAFAGLVPAMLLVLKAAIDDEDDAHIDEDFVQDILGCFVEVADVNTHFFRTTFREVCGAMSFIGSDRDQESELRHMALEFFATSAQQAAPMVRMTMGVDFSGEL